MVELYGENKLTGLGYVWCYGQQGRGGQEVCHGICWRGGWGEGKRCPGNSVWNVRIWLYIQIVLANFLKA